jgi:hypothetical protein
MHAMCEVHGVSLFTVNFGLQYSDLLVGMVSLKPHTEVVAVSGSRLRVVCREKSLWCREKSRVRQVESEWWVRVGWEVLTED